MADEFMGRHKTYHRHIIETGTTEELPFDNSHVQFCKNQNWPATPDIDIIGLPETTALRLVNHWNWQQQMLPQPIRYLYWL